MASPWNNWPRKPVELVWETVEAIEKADIVRPCLYVFATSKWSRPLYIGCSELTLADRYRSCLPAIRAYTHSLPKNTVFIGSIDHPRPRHGWYYYLERELITLEATAQPGSPVYNDLYKGEPPWRKVPITHGGTPPRFYHMVPFKAAVPTLSRT